MEKFLEELGPGEAIFRNRVSISNIVGEIWEGVASLVLPALICTCSFGV
ncbi:MAG: hypothetical protein VCA12_02905 [Pseudomonadales bacterium]